MKVIKRSGESEDVSFDKVLQRMRNLCCGYDKCDLSVDVYDISQKVCARIYNNVATSDLDELAAQICSSMIVNHPDYGELASRIIVSNHHKNTSPSFSETMSVLYHHKDGDGEDCPLISAECFEIVMRHKEKLNSYIDYMRDYEFDYFGFKTLERAYLMKVNGVVVERPQHMFMRVSLGVHGSDIKDALQMYDLMSKKYYIHATPTLFNAGTRRPQLSSCFLLASEDSIEGIYDTLKECANISKYAGGIGMHIHTIRAKGSKIRGTNGNSTGIIPMLRVFNNTARYVNQSGKRNGSIAVYIEPWHADIESFIELRKPHGNEEERTRDLFTALWIPDLFMKRVQENKTWSLMCPDMCKGLSDTYGEEFERLYETYEAEGKFVKQVSAQKLWFKMLESQIESGQPYILYKDACNKKSNQKNLGVIKSSNLCTEIIEFTNSEETAVCNLASIALPSYVMTDNDSKPYIDYAKLHEVTKVVTKNLNKVIDVNFYPVPKARVSNLRHRPIGIGVQGLADLFVLMGVAFDSDAAIKMNKNVFETIYHAALEASMEISKKRHEMIIQMQSDTITGEERLKIMDHLKLNEFDAALVAKKSQYPGSYTSFEGSPISQGILQFDMWNVKPSDRYDWSSLRNDIMTYGVRNSLLLAPMPTASTSQILGFNECIEPFTSNLYKRKTMAGEFIVINKYLIRKLIDLGIWTKELKDKIIINDGSVQGIDDIPQEVQHMFKTVWEIKQKVMIDMAADRGAFICQSQSLNLFMEDPDFQKLTSMHFYSWKKGLKTGMYYLRSKAKAQAQKFTIDPSINRFTNLKPSTPSTKNVVCTDEVCTVCSS